MKAIRAHIGKPDLRYEDVPAPELLGPTDVIVRLKAAGFGPDDLLFRGMSKTNSRLPRIIGRDGAGMISATGSEVRGLTTGDRVVLYPVIGCGICSFCIGGEEILCPMLGLLGASRPGTAAEYIAVPAGNCFKIPAGFSFEDAAAVASPFTIAWRMLVNDGELIPGEHVLIRAVGLPVAIAALKIAVHLRARVIVTAKTEEHLQKARALGAETAILETAEFDKELRRLTGKRGVDLAVDCIGGQYWSKTLACLAKGGRVVTCAVADTSNPPTDLRRIFWNNLNVFGCTFGDRQDLLQALRFVEETKIKPVIARTLPLERAIDDYEDPDQFGSTVLQIADS